MAASLVRQTLALLVFAGVVFVGWALSEVIGRGDDKSLGVRVLAYIVVFGFVLIAFVASEAVLGD